MALLICFWLFGILRQGASAPVSADYVTWQSEPNTRGTWSILSSCIVTLVLCVYTAVHMNVPNPCESPLHRRLRLAKWVLAGTFAPEIVVWIAWRQWSESRKLSRDIKEMESTSLKDDDLPPFNPAVHSRYRCLDDLISTWTSQHSFFVLMGGYQFHPSIVETNHWNVNQPRCILSTELFLTFLKEGHVQSLPVLTANDLADRSKADHLAKLLSCIQGLWLVVQLIGRLVGNLSITELEVNTVAHVLCAVVMYAFWLNKPLNIVQPAWIDVNGLESYICLRSVLPRPMLDALFWSKLPYSITQSSFRPSTHIHDKAVDWRSLRHDCPTCFEYLTGGESGGYPSVVGLVLRGSSTDTDPAKIVGRLNGASESKYFINFIIQDRSFKYNFEKDKLGEEMKHVIGKSGFLRRAIIIKSQQQLEAFLTFWNQSEKEHLLTSESSSRSLSSRASMIPSGSSSHYVSMLGIIAASCCYGGLHASLWQHHFPTVVESWLWRISSAVIAGNGIIATGGTVFVMLTNDEGQKQLRAAFGGHDPFYMIRLFKFLEDEVDSRGIKVIEWSLIGFLWSVMGLFCLLQLVAVFCRLFIFIEAFISLRSQSASAYLTPQWSQWLPHL